MRYLHFGTDCRIGQYWVNFRLSRFLKCKIRGIYFFTNVKTIFRQKKLYKYSASRRVYRVVDKLDR